MLNKLFHRRLSVRRQRTLLVTRLSFQVPVQMSLHDRCAASLACRLASVTVHLLEMLIEPVLARENLVALRASVRYAAAAL